MQCQLESERHCRCIEIGVHQHQDEQQDVLLLLEGLQDHWLKAPDDCDSLHYK